MNQLNVGVISLGRIGKCHLDNLVQRIPKANLCAVSDHSGKNVAFAQGLGIPAIYQNPNDVIQHPDIEAVVICSPSQFHYKHIQAAAKAGKHIFAEKPLDLTIAKIEQIAEMVEQYQIKLQVGFNRRFDANFSAVQKMVQAGKVGEPHILKITSRDPAPPPIEYLNSSGGMFLDMSIHDFDMARFIVGSEVEEVFAKGAVLVDNKIGEAGDIDTAVITLRFANGCLAVIDNSRQAVYGYDQRLEIFGSKGMSKIENNYSNTQTIYDAHGRQAAGALNFFMERYKESYFQEMKAFVDAVIENKAVPVSCEDALKATQIALAAKASLKLNKPQNLE